MARWAKSIADLSEEVGFSTQYLYQLRRKGLKIAKVKGKGYDANAIRAWIKDNVAQRKNGQEDPDKTASLRDQLTKEQIQKRRQENQLLEIKVKAERGQYITKDDHENDMLALIAIFKKGLLGMGGKVAGSMVGLNEREMRQVWDKMSRELLQKLSDS